MKKIEVKILNPEIITDIKKMCVTAARLTQRAHNIKCMDDFITLYNKQFKDETYNSMTKLSHKTLFRFCNINIVITGASRRFLSQITRHQAGFTFMSGSLQYSDYSSDADFVIPYEVIENHKEQEYLDMCKQSMQKYKNFVDTGINNDDAGYMSPQGLRNILIISANPLALKQMISTRSCNRNTKETQYVVLKIWEELYKLDPILFSPETTGPSCQQYKCQEGKMSCKCPFLKTDTPTKILQNKFKLLY